MNRCNLRVCKCAVSFVHLMCLLEKRKEKLWKSVIPLTSLVNSSSTSKTRKPSLTN